MRGVNKDAMLDIPNNVPREFETLEKMVESLEKSITDNPQNRQCSICNVCGKEGMSNAIKNHIEANHIEGITIPCNSCDKTFRTRNGFIDHKREHNTNERKGEKNHKCKMCVFSSSSASRLTSHNRIHSGEKPFICKLCTYTSAWNGGLKKHMKTHTKKPLPFSCKHCIFICSSASRLTKHLQTHEKDFRCNKFACKFTCMTAAQLKSHKETHSKRSFCKTCLLGPFTTAEYLLLGGRLGEGTEVECYPCKSKNPKNERH